MACPIPQGGHKEAITLKVADMTTAESCVQFSRPCHLQWSEIPAAAEISAATNVLLPLCHRLPCLLLLLLQCHQHLVTPLHRQLYVLTAINQVQLDVVPVKQTQGATYQHCRRLRQPTTSASRRLLSSRIRCSLLSNTRPWSC